MGRGGGVVAGSKHSVENEKHYHSSSSGGGGSADPKCMGAVFAFIGIVFLVLTIVVPIVMVAKPSGDKCSPATTLNRNEQMVCVPDDLKQKWVAEYDKSGAKYTTVHRLNKNDVEYDNLNYTWYNYHADLKGSYDYFGFSVPIQVTGGISVYCDGKKCDHLRMYLLNSKQFKDAVDSNGEFHEKTFDYDWKDFDDERTNFFTYKATGPDYFYLVFSNNKNKEVTLVYSISMYNKVFNTKNVTASKCEDYKCTFDDMKKDEFLVMTYNSPSTSSWYNDKSVEGPEYFSASMHNLKIHWGAVVAVIVVFAIITIICAIAAIYYIAVK